MAKNHSQKGGKQKLILKESPQDIIQFSKAQKSKLQNMKDQLDILLRKKYRLELEIKALRTSIQNKRTSSEKTLKLKLSAEGNLEPIPKSDQIYLAENYQDLNQALKEFDQCLKNIDDYLQETSDLDLF